ncbi:MAG: histidine kinase, partial [Actinomycetota bacterium]|nr:histidine kinase [Actinomycetota bacterium]
VLDQLSDPDAFISKVRALYDNPTESSVDILEFTDGRVFERYSHPQWVEGEVVGRVWSFRDITEQHFALTKINDALGALTQADRERRRLLTHLVKAKEEERARVAADIHDDAVQIMTSVAIEMERLEKRIDDAAVKERLMLLQESVRAAIGSLRSTVFELKPPALTDEGLVAALGLYLEEFHIETGIRYELTNTLGREPPHEVRVGLFRIAQEALVNVRKHARARRVWVELASKSGGICLRVGDDGIGIDATRPKKGSNGLGHIGITEMRERAEMHGGHLTIDSRDGTGTVVEAWIPLQGAPASAQDETTHA